MVEGIINLYKLDTQYWLCPEKLHAIRTVHGMHTEALHTQNWLCMPWTVRIALSFAMSVVYGTEFAHTQPVMYFRMHAKGSV